MMRTGDRQLLLDLLTLPTAPFSEQYVIRYIAAWTASRPGLQLWQDRFGNLQIGLRRTGERPVPQGAGETPGPHITTETPVPHCGADGPRVAAAGQPRSSDSGGPLVLAAHMDHPGFEADRMLRKGVLRAHWRGGVAPEYFPGAKVRFYVEGAWIRGRIERVHVVDDRGRKRVQRANVAVPAAVPPGAIGMWDFPDPTVRGSRLHARGCDDVAGVAAILAAMNHLAGRREPVDVVAMFNRAEEVGFMGAMAACREQVVPSGSHVISVECSSELAGGRMGQGPILRVGDFTTVFTPELTAFCRRVAEDLASRSRRFRFQRKLMDGGTCEASAFLAYGYRTSGLCIALGNYHNMDRKHRRIAAEYVDLNDWQGLVDWFVALAIAHRGYCEAHRELPAMLDRLYEQWAPLLESTSDRVRQALSEAV